MNPTKPIDGRRTCRIAFPLRTPFFCLVGLLLCDSLPAEESEEPEGVPPLKVVYFIPSDCSPPPDRSERLGRVMKHIQSFFRSEMDRYGFGPRTFALEWAAKDRLKLYEIAGKNPAGDYGRNSAPALLAETRFALASQGIDMDEEYVLIMTPLLLWQDDGTATESGPYGGGGSTFSGCAWVYDDPLLDPDLLPSKEPGGYFFGPCSKGAFNSKYIGGIAFGLGHAFNLPRERESAREKKKFGTSLMGHGNLTYGNELRDEGLGTFLSESAATRLAVCRAFNPGYQPDAPPSTWELSEIRSEIRDGKIHLTGHGDSGTPPIDVIAYNGNLDKTHYLDTTSWVGSPDADGNFQIIIEDLKPVRYELRLVSVFLTGEVRRMTVRYSNTSGTPDLEPINTAIYRAKIKDSFRRNRMEDVGNILRELAEKHPGNDVWKRKIDHLNALENPDPEISLADVPPETKQVDLALAEIREAKVGWHQPAKRQVPEEGFLEVNRVFFESGLYAHAPSVYEFVPGKQWKTLKFGIGLQDGHPGSVVFVVLGDGRKLFRSKTIKSDEIHWDRVDVTGVETLKLITEDAGNGTAHDWGVWIEPQLSR